MHSLLITGYKAHELGVYNETHEGIKWIKTVLAKRVEHFIEEGVAWFITSGQTGIEQWAIDVVTELRDQVHTHIKLAILPPFENQEANWSERAQEWYQERLLQADFVECISKRPYEHMNQLKQKNDYLIHKTDGLLVLYDEEKQGSPLFYIRSANQQDKPIFYISPEDIEEARREAMDDF